MGADRAACADAPRWVLWPARTVEATRVLLLDRTRTRIGREPGDDVDLVITDPAVSRVHAVITRFPGEETLWVQDLESRNGTFVNGQRVEGAPLRAGDVMRLGDAVFVVGRGPLAPEDDLNGLGFVGRSPAMAELRAMIRKVAPSALPVLALGATGTGKELVARAVHAESGRRGAFVAVNCAALPASLVESVLFGHKKGSFTGAVADQDGAFVQADGGTLFLDELGDLAREAQPKLLRALEDGEITPLGAAKSLKVDVRVVAATHVPLTAAIAAETFRMDLYARVAGVVVATPALVDRREDILSLFASFLEATALRPMTADFAEALLLHAWPFNVRELRHMAERLSVLHPDARAWERPMLVDAMLPDPALVATSIEGSLVPAPPPREPRSVPPDRDALVALLARCDGNVSRVASFVGRSRKQIYRWMKQHAVDSGTGRKG